MSENIIENTEVGQELKSKVNGWREEKVQQEEKEKQIMTQLGGLAVQSDVADFYRQNASVGVENVGDSLPWLKVTEALSNNEDIEGQYAPRGTLYYMPDRSVFKEVEVSILAISRGFYSLDKGNPPRPKFSQLVGGIILGSNKPFIMASAGTRWPKMNEFIKSIRPFTKHKEFPVPLFAFRVKLTTEAVKNDRSQESYVVNYSLIRNAENQIETVRDLETLSMLRGGVDRVVESFENFISAKEVDKETGRPLGTGSQTVSSTVQGNYGGGEFVSDVESSDVRDLSDNMPPF